MIRLFQRPRTPNSSFFFDLIGLPGLSDLRNKEEKDKEKKKKKENEQKKDQIEKSIITEIDAKTKLQEYSLKIYKKLPIYKLISNTGPRHQPIIKVSVKLYNGKIFYGEGKSKKDAEQNAASLCLSDLD